MDVDVRVEATGDRFMVVFELPDGRVLVTMSGGSGAALFRDRGAWLASNTPYDAVETYDSVAEAFADLA
ncbi:MAG: hypothetical protein AMXMBFR23_27400 [Chloroflexota bacterium]